MGGSIAKADSRDAIRSAPSSFPGSLPTDTARAPPPPASAVPAAPMPSTDEEELVPTVFEWCHGGNQVFITGTFNGWSCKVQMYRSGNNFTYVQALPKGRHAYKFIVDDGWRFAPDQPTVADTAGNINNFIDLTDFKPDSEVIPSRNDTLVGVPYTSDVVVEEDLYTRDPPLLPPHLRHITLNAVQGALPVPQHVTLNHLYCTTIRDKLMVQGITQRYRSKFTTTVYYSIMPLSSHATAAAAVGMTMPTEAPAVSDVGFDRVSPTSAHAQAQARGQAAQAYAEAAARAVRNAGS